MKYIDKSIWSRAELFDFFSTVDHPFYSTTFRVDVTQLHKYTKSHGISFYYALTYLVILSILVYTFFSRMFDLMLPPVAKHSIVVA